MVSQISDFLSASVKSILANHSSGAANSGQNAIHSSGDRWSSPAFKLKPELAKDLENGREGNEREAAFSLAVIFLKCFETQYKSKHEN